MRLFAGERQTGKTLNAIREAHRAGAYLVVRSYTEAQRCAALAERCDWRIHFPITFDEFLSMRGQRVPFVVDGVEALLEYLAHGNPVVAATFDTTFAAEGSEKP